ncbi:SIS domain-containing protein [Herbiconiux sp. CPCC 205763]|uniref:Glutamine--fructose-6-phosphate aminotransferase [isomerizing] n=1 Tax=Herbiconiux aconitum TaxID=2970913 RepID=A0ABT2GRQ4_9MICO|nr:SIS domain-containing protein [Herbiconiux aconitum]MCS5718848.1 SIS domain-containing protein [Herbiconiux aconitum]
MKGYVPLAEARRNQVGHLEPAIDRIAADALELQASGALSGPGPIFVGIGASLAAAAAPVWVLRKRGIHSWRLGAGDLPLPFPASVHPIIGISQSGKSSETLAVLESVPPSLRLAVVNNAPSPIADVASRSLVLGNIPDSYASTIGYTATIVALGMIADLWDGGTLDADWHRLADDFRSVEAQLAERSLSIAQRFATAPSADFVGAGPAVGSAEAGALLFREVARVHSTAMSTRQYLHGSMESAGDGVHVVLGDAREIALAQTLSEAGHQVVLVTSQDVPQTSSLTTISLPRRHAAQRAVLEAAVMQAFANDMAFVRGIDVEEFVFHNADTKVESAAAPASELG